MIIEIELFTPLDEDLLNDKEALINVANDKLAKYGTVKDVAVERVYVFSNGEEGAVMYFRYEGDDEGFYRGGICFDKSDVDTVLKVQKLYFRFKHVQDEYSSERIDEQMPLLLETYNIVANVEVENLDDWFYV